MKVTPSPSLRRPILFLLVVAACTTVFSRAPTPRHLLLVTQQVTLQTGPYVGKAINTTAAPSIKGRVAFHVTDFDTSSGQVKAAMLFSDGLCGNGSFIGIVVEDGMTLSGVLATNDVMCGSQSWNMVTRCKFKGRDTLTCSYRLFQADSTIPNQKGTFEVTRSLTKQPTNPSSTTSPRVTSSSTSRSVSKRPPITTRPNRRVEFPKEDPGVDLAVVIARKANLRDGPDISSAVVMETKQDDYLVLVDRVPVGPWYNVIHVDSSNEGWINGNAVAVKYSQERKIGPLLEERSTGGNQNPYLKVTNDSEKILYLKLGDNRYTIDPHATETVYIAPGFYKYYASSPGIIPAFGEDNLRAGYSYSWQFYIVTVP